MKKEYICPKCHGNLNIGRQLVFLAKNENKRKGMVFLHHEIGNYSCHRHPTFSDNSEITGFYCPLCRCSLSSDIDDNLTLVLMNDGQKESKVYFSKLSRKNGKNGLNGNRNGKAINGHSEKYTYFTMQDKFKQYLKL